MKKAVERKELALCIAALLLISSSNVPQISTEFFKRISDMVERYVHSLNILLRILERIFLSSDDTRDPDTSNITDTTTDVNNNENNDGGSNGGESVPNLININDDSEGDGHDRQLVKFEPPDGEIYHFSRITSQADYEGKWFDYDYERYMNIVDNKQLAGFHNIVYWLNYNVIKPPEEYGRFYKFIRYGGSIMMGWMPGEHEGNGGDVYLPPNDIISGVWDEYLRQWANFIKNTSVPWFIDFCPESNGDWFPWSWNYGTWNGDLHWTKEEYKQVWRYVQGVFDSFDVENVAWVWRPAVNVNPESDGYKYFYTDYPGDDLVDWIGLSHYNYIDVSYSDPFIQFAKDHDKPLMYTEFATSIAGFKDGYWQDGGHPGEGYPYYPGDADWTDAMMQKVEDRNNRIKLISWFNVGWTCPDGDECTWIDRDPEQAVIYKEHILKDCYILNMYG